MDLVHRSEVRVSASVTHGRHQKWLTPPPPFLTLCQAGSRFGQVGTSVNVYLSVSCDLCPYCLSYVPIHVMMSSRGTFGHRQWAKILQSVATLMAAVRCHSHLHFHVFHPLGFCNICDHYSTRSCQSGSIFTRSRFHRVKELADLKWLKPENTVKHSDPLLNII